MLIILMSYRLFAQTNWYVDNTASGSNNGTSWTNAWTSLANINWSSIHAGDNIYISGGTNGKVYNEQLAPQCIGTATNYISILPGKYSPSPLGHSGKVTIQYVLIDEYGGTIAKYVRIKGFEITGNDGGGVRFDADLGWAKGIIIDSCYIHDYGTGFGVAVLAYCDSTIIQNNIILDCENGSCPGDRDGIHVNEAGGIIPRTTIIRNNWVRITSQDPTAHNDAFQAVSGDGFYVYNNVFINDSVNSIEGGGMPSILSAVDADNNDSPPVLVFNNFMFMNGIWYPNANQGWVYELRHDAGTTWAQILPTYVFGNTMVSNGPRNRVFGNGEAYLNLALNNIWASYCPPDAGGANDWRTGSTHGWMEALGLGAVYTTHYMYQDSIRYNLFWRQDSTEGQNGNQSALIVGEGYIYHTGGTGGFDNTHPFADWIAKGGTGLFRDPKLVTPFGHLSNQGAATPDIEPSSPAIDAGENYSYLVSYLHNTYPVVPQDVLDAILVDFYGNPRGADGYWDIGAVEYQKGITDTIPSFNFTAVNNAELNTEYIGSATFSGADSTFHVWTTTGALFQINSGGYSTATKTAANGDVVYVKNTSSSNYYTSTEETIVAGGYSRIFQVTTKQETPVSGGRKPMKFKNGAIIKDSTGKIIR